MADEEPHTRSPIMASWNESPISGLRKHSEKVNEAMRPLRKALIAYVNEDYEEFERCSKLVRKRENEADEIKAAIRTHMPWALLMPVDKSFFLMTLHDEDGILDKAEDTVIWLSMRRTEIPDEIKEDLLHYFDLIEKTMKVYTEVVHLFQELAESGFAKKDLKILDEKVKKIHEMENIADEEDRALTRRLFSMEGEMDTLGIYHLMKAIYIIGLIANQSENAAERILAMASK